MPIRDWLPEISEYLQETLWVHGFGRIPDSFLASDHDEQTLERHFVISYSRRELYFAESLAKELRDCGLPTWLDVERLQPGADWQAQIEDSLAACDALLLVASKAAMASTYVRREWESALEQKKPIYLAIFEAVDLPRELKYAGAVDFRGNFGRATRRLVSCLKGDPCPQGRIPEPNLFNLPTNLSPGVFLVTCVFLLLSAWLLILAWRLPPLLAIQPWITGTVLLALNLALLIVLWRFIHRRLSQRQIKRILILPISAVIILSLLLPITLLVDLGFEWSALRGLFVLSLLISLLSAGCGLASQYSADLLRWSPVQLDELDELRSRIYRHRYQDNRGFRAAVSTAYAIHHDPADEPVARSLCEVMAEAGHNQVPPTTGETAQHLVILSNWTRRAWLNALPPEMEPLIPVIGSNLKDPADPQLTRFLEYQVVDYRTRESNKLEALAEHLAHPESRYVLYEVTHLPLMLERWLVPPPVKKWSIGLVAATSYGLAGAFFGHGRQLLSGPNQIITLALALISAGLLAWLSYRLLKRDLAGRWSIVLFAVAIAGLSRTLIAELLAFVSKLSFAGFEEWPARLTQEPTLSLLALFVAAYIANQYRRDLSSWLPAPTSPFGKGERLGSPSPRKFWLRQSLLAAATAAGFFLAWIYLFTIFQD